MQVQLLVWIFVMRIMMVVAGRPVVFHQRSDRDQAKYGNVDKMNFESPLTYLVCLTSIVSVMVTYVVSYFLIPILATGRSGGNCRRSSLRHAGGRDHPGAGQGLHLDRIGARAGSRHLFEKGGASLNILSGLVAGNFSAYWLGMIIASLMAIALFVASPGPRER